MSEYMNNNNMNTNVKSMAMDWDDVIENDGNEFIILPEGDYNFTVTNLERGHFPGSAKMEPSHKATVTLRVSTDDGMASVRTDFILNHLVEFKISEFFRSIGTKKRGEKLAMNWNNVIGTRGRAHFKPRTYVGNDGKEHQANNVERFYDYDESFFKPEDSFTQMNVTDEDIPF